MIEAQIARDEAMAEALAAFTRSEAGRNRKVVVLCGSGYVAYGQGMPTGVRRRLSGTRERILRLSESGELHFRRKRRPRHAKSRSRTSNSARSGGPWPTIWVSNPSP
jgi:uncharacterized iron-regulated protein